MSQTTSLVLEFPFEHQGVKIERLIVRRPKGRDMRFFPRVKESDGMAVEDMYPFWAMLASTDGKTPITEELIDDMDTADIHRLGELVSGFLERKGKTPARPKPAR